MPTRLEGDRVLVNNRWVHGDGTNLGFLNTGGGWDMYANNSGQIWGANYGWLHDYFFSGVSNCARRADGSNSFQGAPNCMITDNCYNCGDFAGNANYRMYQLFDVGGTVRFGAMGSRHNCNCDCICC